MEIKMFGTQDWSEAQREQFGQQFHLSEHKLHTLDIFSRPSLVQLLDSIPKRNIQCYTMTPNAAAIDSVTAVNADACNGEKILTAAENGLFWFNIKRLENHNREFAELLASMFKDLTEAIPSLDANELSCDLLVTSPAAHTHYHIDRGPTMLWHLSGRKRLWVYPEMDFKFIPQNSMEELFAGERLEYMPYKPEFDDKAIAHEIAPGEAVAWPNTAPHRVENIDFNISLVVSYATKSSVKRANLQRANHYILKPLGIKKRSVKQDTWPSDAKHFYYRAANKILKFKPKSNFKEDYSTSLVVNLDEDGCIVNSAEVSKPQFMS
jgi:hypothetical protein